MGAPTDDTGPPAWFKAFGIGALLVVLVVVALHLAGRGLGGHAGPSGAGDHGGGRP